MKNHTQKIIFCFLILNCFFTPLTTYAMSGAVIEDNTLHTAAPESNSLVAEFFQVDSLLPFLLLLITLGLLGLFFIKKSTK